MNIFLAIMWLGPLAVMTFSGLFLLALRGRPICARSNAHQLSVLAMAAASLVSLARFQTPPIEVIVLAWSATIMVVLRALREIKGPPIP